MDTETGNKEYTRVVNAERAKLVVQDSRLLNLSGELRNMIYEFVLDTEAMLIGGQDGNVAFEPYVNPQQLRRINEMQYLRRQMWAET